MRRLGTLALALAALGAPAAWATSIAPMGCLQAPGLARGCTTASGLEGAAAVAVSPDGRNVYVAGSVEEHGTLLTFAREPASGALAEIGCAADSAREGCVASGALYGANDVAISADGRTVYVLGILPGSVGVFRRDPETGALTEVQCLREGYGTPTCTRGPFENVWKFVLTPDGRQLIVAGSHLTRLTVGPGGLLSDPHAERVSGIRSPAAIAASPDGRSVYVAGGMDDRGKLSVLRRDPASGALTVVACAGDGTTTGRPCTPARGVHGPADLAVSPDGRGVYLAASSFTSSDPVDPFGFSGTLHTSALSVFSPERGRQRACLLFAGRERERDGCRHAPRARGPGFAGAAAVAVSPDGKAAVAGFDKSSAVVVLRRNPSTQSLGAVAGRAGCVRDAPSPAPPSRRPRGCAVGHGIFRPTDIAISPDGRNAYVTTPGGLAEFALVLT